MSNVPTCLAPDLHTRAPNYRAPPRACDSHCHIIGPADRYPYLSGRHYRAAEAPLARFKELQAILGLARAVLVTAGCYGCDNSVVVDAIAQSGGNYRGVAQVDDSFTAQDFAMLHQAGIRGVRFSVARDSDGRAGIAALQRAAERIKPFGWHVDLQVHADQLSALEATFQSLPVPFVIDHMGRVPTEHGLAQRSFQTLLQLARTNERCWVKISGAERISSAGPPFTDALPFVQALIAAAPERVLWGTDWPHLNTAEHMPNDGDLVDLIPLMTPDAVMQRRILVDNPQQLYQFE